MKYFVAFLESQSNGDSELATALSKIVLSNKHNTILCATLFADVLKNLMLKKFPQEYIKVDKNFFNNLPCDLLAASSLIISRNIKQSPRYIARLYIVMMAQELQNFVSDFEEINTIYCTN